ncbi:MAG: hypothetical protein CSA21_00385 [Deltaproteobacteria bacterium]|nr:MAG: hypothetical protein CSA21_00385 [Deltaproteobacteria bacterium]
MEAGMSFHFLRPWWFAALVPLLALLWLLWRRRLRSLSWAEVCDAALLPHLLMNRSSRRPSWPIWLLLTGLGLAVIALAGPTWKQRPQPLFQQQTALVLCMDLSRSMLAADLKPSRLVRMRLKAEDILNARTEGQVGLVVFAGAAFAVMPLSNDRNGIINLLPALDPALMPVQGSNIAQALEMSVGLLQRGGSTRGAVLLLTDEDQPEQAVAAAQKLRAAGYRLMILGIGTAEGAPIPLGNGGFFKDHQGNLALPGRNGEGLQKLAAAAGGLYAPFTVDDSDFSRLLADEGNNGIDSANKNTDRLGDSWQEEGGWLLIPLALLAALAFRRGWLLVVLLMLPLDQAEAFTGKDLWLRPDQQAYRSFMRGDFAGAAKQFTDERWKAGAHYREGHFDQSLELFPEITADDWYNRGNSLARSGRLQEAIKAYDRALQLCPDDRQAQENREVVRNALKQQQQQQEQEGPQGEQGKETARGSTQQQKQMDNDNSPQQGSEAGAPAPKQEYSEEESAEASAEEGERHQEEDLQEQASEQEESDEKGGDPPQQKVEQEMASPEERDTPGRAADLTAGDDSLDEEERELQEHLGRIPDDPGGLLRRKFLYQYRDRRGQREGERSW